MDEKMKYELLEQIEANIPGSDAFEDYELEKLEYFSEHVRRRGHLGYDYFVYTGRR